MKKLKIYIPVFIVLLIVIVVSVRGCGKRSEQPIPDFVKVIVELPMFDYAEPQGGSGFDAYLKFYGLSFEGVNHKIFKFDSGGLQLAGNIFTPEQPSDTVICLHGYMNHCNQLKNLIRELVGNNFLVACFDLPGHGISQGERGDIDDFSMYSKALTDFIATIEKDIKGDIHVLGFSTGGSAVIDALLCDDSFSVDKVVLVSPLVHNKNWAISKLGYDAGGWAIDSVPNMYVKNCDNPEYREFNRNDPLILKDIPLSWLTALYKWNEKIEACQTSDKAIKIIQGDKDGTVDSDFNMEFLQRKFPNADITIIEGADHELLNEKPEYRMKVLHEIVEYIKD